MKNQTNNNTSEANSELTRQRWRQCLYESLAAENNSHETCCEITKRFDTLSENGKMEAENAASIIYSAYGATDTTSMLSRISLFIKSNLENFNATSKGIDSNVGNRWRNMAQRYNAALDKIKISVGGKDVVLSDSELDRIKIQIPSWISKPVTTYASEASANLSLEIKD